MKYSITGPPFLSDIFAKVETRDQRQELCDSTESRIVLATAGMMNGEIEEKGCISGRYR